jgi:hypothetical protein
MKESLEGHAVASFRAAIRQPAVALPSRQLVDLARRAAGGHQPNALGIAIPAAWVLAAGGAADLTLRRREAAA